MLKIQKIRKTSATITKVLLLSFSLNIPSSIYSAASSGGSFNKAMLEKKTEKESINGFYAAFLKNQVEIEREEERLKQELRHQKNYDASHPEQPKIFEIESIKLLMRYFDTIDNKKELNKVDTYFSANVYNDLNVFPDPQNLKKVTVFSDFSNLTRTMAGKLGLLEMLSNPLSDIEKLRERQRIIEHLSKNNDLFNQLDACLAKFGKAEKSLLYFMKIQDDGNNRDDFKRYFDEKIAASAGSIGNNAVWYGDLALRTLPSDICALTCLAVIYYMIIDKNPLNGLINHRGNRESEYRGNYNLAEPRLWRSAGFLLMFASYFGMKKSWNYLVAPRTEMGKRFQSCMIDVNEIVQATQEIGELIGKNETIATAFSGYKDILDSISGENGNELKSILDLFDSSAFKGDASTIGPKGKIFKAFKVMCEKADKFTEIMRFVSRLDAIMSVVKALRASANNPAKYCIPKFLKTDDGKPYLSAKKFWHPTLDPRKVVTNDIELGKTYRNIILTGANAGGKTTWMQGLALVAVLAQTFGIVPAEAANLTPFSLVIADTKAESMIGVKSMYEDEVNKLIDATKKIQSLGADKFAIYIVDEPLKGSNAEMCANEAYKAIKRFGLHQNALVVVATHFEKLTELGDQDNIEAEIKGVFANYKVDSRLYECAKYPDKFLHHTFKIVPGVITEIVTDFLLQEAYKKHNLININATDLSPEFQLVQLVQNKTAASN